MSSEKARAAQQTIVNNILKTNQNKFLTILLLYDIETTTEAESKIKLLLNRFDSIKYSNIEDATEIAKNKNFYLLQ